MNIMLNAHTLYVIKDGNLILKIYRNTIASSDTLRGWAQELLFQKFLEATPEGEFAHANGLTG